jgi:predicted Zn finger-like uncharacterized protein
MIATRQELELRCPECDARLRLAETELAAAPRVECKHCGTVAYLSHYREFADEPAAWRLESELPDDPGLGAR